MRLYLCLIALAGCNWIYGLDETRIRDAALAPDGTLLLLAPDGTRSCPPAPDFEAWTYQPVAGLATGVEHASFLADDRVVLGRSGALYETSLAGAEQRLTDLDMMDGAMLRSPSAAPDRSIFWFMRFQFNAGGPYIATFDGARWTQQRADFGITAYQFQVGSAAYFGGAIRMVLAVQKTTEDRLRLVEHESHDGFTWSALDTTPWSAGLAPDFDPALSADGCLLVFRRIVGATKLYVAHRDGDTFAPPVELVKASAGASVIGSPAIDPSRTRLWFVRDNVLYEGRP